MDELKKQHDEHLANKPDSMSDEDFAALMDAHKENCPFCNENVSDKSEQDDPEERGDMDKEFTQADVDEAVAKAVAPFQTELDELKASIAETEVDSRVAEAKAEAAKREAELQEELEAAMLKAGNAETELTNVLSYLEGEKEASELAELAEAIRADRKAKVEEVANFDNDFIEANLDRWCAEDDEAFEARVQEWAASSVKSVETASASGSTTVIKNVRPVSSEVPARALLGDILGTKG